jgi:hypothetical protein
MDRASLPEALSRRNDFTSVQIYLRRCGHRRVVDVLDIEGLMIEEVKSGVNIKTG